MKNQKLINHKKYIEMKILHIITGLGRRWCRIKLFKICKFDNIKKHIVKKLLKDKGKYFSLLKKLKIKVYCLNFNFFQCKFFLSY